MIRFEPSDGMVTKKDGDWINYKDLIAMFEEDLKNKTEELLENRKDIENTTNENEKQVWMACWKMNKALIGYINEKLSELKEGK